MAARRRKIRHDDETRAKIQTTQLIKRLYGHALGEIELSPTQVRAAEVLLRKTLPDLTAAEITQETMVRYVARVPDKKPDTDSWQHQHAPETTLQ